MNAALIRHPKPLIAPGICYGRMDVEAEPLNAPAVAGIVARLLDLCAPCVVASPARRCRALAEALGSALGAPPVYDERLRELDFGDWEGQRWDEIDRASLDAWAADPGGFQPSGGEAVSALISRVTAVSVALRAERRDAVIVSHGGPLRLLIPLLQGLQADPLAPPPHFGSVSLIRCHPVAAASAVRTAHSATCSVAPRTSPV